MWLRCEDDGDGLGSRTPAQRPDPDERAGQDDERMTDDERIPEGTPMNAGCTPGVPRSGAGVAASAIVWNASAVFASRRHFARRRDRTLQRLAMGASRLRR
jgi:hypothetical protein